MTAIPAMTAYAVDTETTGVTNPEVIQFAYAEIVARPGPVFECTQTTLSQYKPTRTIELGALATHHILPEELESFPSPPEKWELPRYIIGHNIDFDWKVLGSPEEVKRIDTLALAREAWPALDSHKLGALIYYLFPHTEARAMLKDAHSAVADLEFCFKVFLAAIAIIPTEKPIASWGDVWRLSEAARMPKVMGFGKHKGKAIAEVPRDYVDWYRRQDETDSYLIKAFAKAGLCPHPQENAA